MLLQTNSYVVPKEKRTEHARLLSRFRQTLMRLGAEHFQVYEQTGANWSGGEGTGRFVQIMRFRDRKQQVAVQSAERNDPQAQQLIREFCELINFPYQQQQGLFAVGFYTSIVPAGSGPMLADTGAAQEASSDASSEQPAAIGTPAAPVPGEPIEPPPDEQATLNGALNESDYNDGGGEEPLESHEQEDVPVPNAGTDETSPQSGGAEAPEDKGPH
jgi:hypothetical protein